MSRTVVLDVAAMMLLMGGAAQAAVVIETVTIGNPGNAPDTRYGTPGYGGVDYVYEIGKYEVTAGQYTEFLNAVSGEDTYGLYHTSMWTSEAGCRIQQTGSPGTYSYSVDPEWTDLPATHLSWSDAARFANWLHNGQPAGAQDLTTTEDGSYYLNGATSGLSTVVREADATWVIPSEDEWYKAAYHYNDGVTGNYYDYPTQSDTAPTAEAPPGTDLANGSANFGYVNLLTWVGAYDAKPSESAYGTYDQGGNMREWNETASFAAGAACSFRGVRGGCYLSIETRLHAAYPYRLPACDAFGSAGLRVALVPEPATLTLLAVGAVLVTRKRCGQAK